MNTYFNRKICDIKPTAASFKLPTRFQVGDEIEIVVDGLEMISGVIAAVKYTSDTISYDVAVPIANTPHYAIITDIRGSMRLKGSYETAEELLLVDADKIKPYLKQTALIYKNSVEHFNNVFLSNYSNKRKTIEQEEKITTETVVLSFNPKPHIPK